MHELLDPEIIYLLFGVTATEVMLPKSLINTGFVNLYTVVNIVKMVNLLFGLKIKHFDRLIIGSRNNIFVI